MASPFSCPSNRHFAAPVPPAPLLFAKRQKLPAEGKKFATVDKNWRQTISSAKSNSKVIEFCNSAKLLERFK